MPNKYNPVFKKDLDITNANVSSLSKAPNEYEWTSTNGQLTYVLPGGATYDPNSKWLEVSVGGAPVPPSKIQKDNSTQFTLLYPTSAIPAGIKVVARWVEPFIPATAGHKGAHEAGGQDEIDVTKLKNYDVITTQLADSAQLIKDISISVKDKQFGAKGDGITDDTVAIQAAIDYVYTQGGGEVKFPKGTYIVNTIYFRQWVSIKGAGFRVCKFKKKTGTTGSIIEFKQENTSYIFSTKYSGFTVEGTGIPTSQTPNNSPDLTNDGLVINHYWGLDNCLFENITISDCGGTGLKIIPSPSNTAASEAMVMQQTLFNRINVKYCTSGGYIKGFVGNIQWNTCTFERCTNNAFESAIGDNGNGAQDNTFINCAFQFSGKGFYAGSNFVNKNFYGCHFEGNTVYDVHFNVNANCGHVKFDGAFFAVTPINVYFQQFGGICTLDAITWKARGSAPSTDRFIKVDAISGTINLGYNQTKLSTPPTQMEDPSFRVRGYSDMANQAVFFVDQIRIANGITSTSTRARNFHKRESIAASATTYTVTFTNTELDANYNIWLTPEANTGTVWVSGKTTSGFTINISNPPASGFAVVWVLLR